MTEVERMARLLCRDPDEMIDGIAAWEWKQPEARRLHEAGLTLLPIEPDEATVDEMARAIVAAEEAENASDWRLWRAVARAAYRAVIGRVVPHD